MSRASAAGPSRKLTPATTDESMDDEMAGMFKVCLAVLAAAA